MSKFQELKQKLEECACPDCLGIGESSDVEAGDTFCNIWVCPTCKGTGINPTCGISLDIERG